MKKILFMALMAVAALGANAQNVQVHYDFGRSFYSDQEDGRQRVTVTLEQFKADQWGSWYYFVSLTVGRTVSLLTLSTMVDLTASVHSSRLLLLVLPIMVTTQTSQRPGVLS